MLEVVISPALTVPSTCSVAGRVLNLALQYKFRKYTVQIHRRFVILTQIISHVAAHARVPIFLEVDNYIEYRLNKQLIRYGKTHRSS